ncbi:succinate dehydrogenase, flavoprotein subunit (Fumarate reductase)-like protein [Ramlibacter tataouinensis TTB310]|uniref:Succinate dehydrogenase, flavoprotein subunit (Fumarate reductase)-like protein n=1 Tax=Ramlibacter tataouinensis (strain ATCC BAA-407 / DSM 14655 / LMG 21543 / TTB310) TaxID=365046 RepID=F5XWI0_RAMTT|nr:succinate dehydrogenase, flavoprotein subunit (Fumarate reductase)-like protein [Ramlibacter tataouinensis TTB310]
MAIVGAGAGGLTAALALRDAGIDCLLLERDAAPGGSTALSSGFIPAAGTRMQRAQGIADSPARFAQDVLAKTDGTAAPHLVRAYAEASAAAIESLAAHGLAFEVLDGFLYPGHSVHRMHTLPQRTGAALMAALQRAAQAAGCDLITSSLVTELWLDAGDRVLGVGFERPDGRREQVACEALLLCCNGFGGNPALVGELLPSMRDAIFAGHAGNDGSALLWGRDIGAGLADLGGYQGHGSWVVPQGALMTWAVMMQGGVQLNAHGRRFHDETRGYSEAAVEVLRQPGGTAWNVFGDRQLALAREFPDFREAEAAGALRTAADRQALAAIIGCTAGGLAPELERLGPPFHAVRVTGALFHTQGGLDIDAGCRVRRPDGSVFPNLLAAGGAARGVSGNAVWGYLSGNGLLSAVAGGWIAARTLSAQLRT